MSRDCSFHKRIGSETMAPNVCAVHGIYPRLKATNPDYKAGEGGCGAEDQSADEAMIRSHYYVEGPDPGESARYCRVACPAPEEHARRRRCAKTRDKIRRSIPITRKTFVSVQHKLNSVRDKLSTTRFDWTLRHRCGQKLLEAVRSPVYRMVCTGTDQNWDNNNEQSRHYQVSSSSLEDRRAPNLNYWNGSNSNEKTDWESYGIQSGTNVVPQKPERRTQTWQQLSEESMCARIRKKKQLHQKLKKEKPSYISTPSVLSKIWKTFIKIKQRKIEDIEENSDNQRGVETEEEEEMSDISLKKNNKKACKWNIMQRIIDSKENANMEKFKKIHRNNTDVFDKCENGHKKKHHKHSKHHTSNHSEWDRRQEELYTNEKSIIDSSYVDNTGEKEIVEKRSSYRKWLNDNVEQRNAEKDRRWLSISGSRKVMFDVTQSGQSIGPYRPAYGQQQVECYNVNSIRSNTVFGGRHVKKCYPKKVIEKCFSRNYSQGKGHPFARRKNSPVEMVTRGSSTGTPNLKQNSGREMNKNSKTQVSRTVTSKESSHKQHKVHENGGGKTCEKCRHKHHKPSCGMHKNKNISYKSSTKD